MHRPIAVRLALAALIATALAGCGSGVPDVVRIGVAQPLSGPSANRGKDLLDGAKLAVAEINVRGLKIDGKPVTLELVEADDKGEVDGGKAAAQQLVEARVHAVIGHLHSHITEAAAPIYASANIPQLFTSSAKNLTQLSGSAFRLNASDGVQAQAISSFAQDNLRAAKVAVVAEDTGYGKPLSEDVVAGLKKAKVEVPVAEIVDAKVKDFAPLVAKIGAAKVDTVVAILRENQLLPLMAELRKAGLDEVRIVASSTAKTTPVAKAELPAKGLFVATAALDTRDFPAGEAFRERFRKEFKADPVAAAHYAYDAVYVLTDTMRLKRSVDPKVVAEGLKTASPTSIVTGFMRFDAQGEQRSAPVAVYRARGGNFEMQARSDRW